MVLILFAEDALPLSSWILWVYVSDAEWYKSSSLNNQFLLCLFLYCKCCIANPVLYLHKLSTGPWLIREPWQPHLHCLCCFPLSLNEPFLPIDSPLSVHFYTFTSSRLFIDISLIRLASDPESLLNGVTVPLRNSSEIHLFPSLSSQSMSFETALTVWPWCLILEACAWSAPSGPSEKCFTYCKSSLLSGCRVNLTSFLS